MSTPSLFLPVYHADTYQRTGATGTSGSEALRQILLNDSISQVTVLTRRPLPIHVLKGAHPKVKIIIHEDFNVYPPSLLKELEGNDGVMWDLGISANGLSEAAYTKITYDYAIAAATAFSTIIPSSSTPTSPKKFVFAFLSGHGSYQDSPSSSWSLFGRVKGITEAKLMKDFPTLATYIFRPAGINPVSPIPEQTAMVRTAVKIYPLLKRIYPSFVIDSSVLANGMLESIIRGGSGKIEGWEGKGQAGDLNVFNNEEIKQLAKGN